MPPPPDYPDDSASSIKNPFDDPPEYQDGDKGTIEFHGWRLGALLAWWVTSWKKKDDN